MTAGAPLPSAVAAVSVRPSPQAADAAGAERLHSPVRPSPGLVTPDEAGAEPGAVALAGALDGAGRKLLLDHLARAYPDVVEAGLAWLEQWHAEARERRRAARNRRSHDRRRRQRGAAQGGQDT